MSGRTFRGLAILVAALASPALAQPAPGGPGGPPDFAQMRQLMMERLKDALAANDDEWKVIQPKVEKVQQLQRDAGAGRGMFMGFGGGGPGGPRGGGQAGGGGAAGRGRDDQPPSAVQQKIQDL